MSNTYYNIVVDIVSERNEVMKSLIIYFSRPGENYGVGNVKVGNTEVIANEIAKLTNADLFKCDPVKPYSSSYSICCDEAKEYQNKNARPLLKQYLTDITNYDVIYIGGPVYWGEYPYEIYSELDKLDFTGKIIKPFTTHEGSGLGDCVKVLKNKCKGATVKSGLAIQGIKIYQKDTLIKLQNWIKE